MTARRANVTDIEHADALALEEGFLPLVQAILPDQAWEAGAVAAPSLIAGDPVVPGGIWILFYAGGGAIGWATAPAVTLGHNFAKAPGPALLADGAEEGTELSSPAVVRLGDRVRVYYLAAGAIWAAEAPCERRRRRPRHHAGRGSTAIRPRPRAIRCCARRAWALSIDRFTARAARDAGRSRAPRSLLHRCHRANTAAAVDQHLRASPARSPAIASPSPPRRSCRSSSATHAPAETPYRDGALLLVHRSARGARDAVAAARSP